MYYTLKDHQGSLTATVHGNTVEQLSYDAWGRRRNTTDFGYGNVSHTFDRGYTLHEHYDDFNLINMNGSCYDPLTSAFLSVDAYVQSPGSAQAFNRYAYCSHNPLRFTDPTGWYQQPGAYDRRHHVCAKQHTCCGRETVERFALPRRPLPNTSTPYHNLLQDSGRHPAGRYRIQETAWHKPRESVGLAAARSHQGNRDRPSLLQGIQVRPHV